MKTSSLFFDPFPPVRQAVEEAVEQAGRAVGQAVRVARLKNRVRWFGYKMIECGGGEFAFVRTDNEGDRSPVNGSYSIEDAEKFVRARENEPVF